MPSAPLTVAPGGLRAPIDGGLRPSACLPLMLTLWLSGRLPGALGGVSAPIHGTVSPRLARSLSAVSALRSTAGSGPPPAAAPALGLCSRLRGGSRSLPERPPGRTAERSQGWSKSPRRRAARLRQSPPAAHGGGASLRPLLDRSSDFGKSPRRDRTESGGPPFPPGDSARRPLSDSVPCSEEASRSLRNPPPRSYGGAARRRTLEIRSSDFWTSSCSPGTGEQRGRGTSSPVAYGGPPSRRPPTTDSRTFRKPPRRVPESRDASPAGYRGATPRRSKSAMVVHAFLMCFHRKPLSQKFSARLKISH